MKPLYSETFSGIHKNENILDNKFEEVVEKRIDASTKAQGIHEGTVDFAIYQIEVEEAMGNSNGRQISKRRQFSKINDVTGGFWMHQALILPCDEMLNKKTWL